MLHDDAYPPILGASKRDALRHRDAAAPADRLATGGDQVEVPALIADAPQRDLPGAGGAPAHRVRCPDAQSAA